MVDDDVVRFLGVPYAEPPVGQRRFARPVPVEPWGGTRASTEAGPDAPQPPWAPSSRGQSEDCLKLNIVAPADRGAARPVLVWFHGGAFIRGSRSQSVTDPAALAVHGDLVVVSVDYRLGFLGFLVDPGAPPGEPKGNWGLLDQLLALRWVRNNVEAFGGDADNITIAGQSAGATSIAVLAATGVGRGLFERAILASGPLSLHTFDFADGIRADLCSTLGAGSIEELRQMPVETIMNVPPPSIIGSFGIGPTVDGTLIPDVPARGGLDIPVMIGTTRNETRLYHRDFQQLTAHIDAEMLGQRLLGRIQHDFDHLGIDLDPQRAFDDYANAQPRSSQDSTVAPFDAFAALSTDEHFRFPSHCLAESWPGEVYEYSFDWPSPQHDGVLGACHTIDLPFVFGTASHPRHHEFVGPPEATAPLVAEAQDAWASFARAGAPRSRTVGDWPRLDAGQRVVHLGREPTIGDVDDMRADLWAGHVDELLLVRRPEAREHVG